MAAPIPREAPVTSATLPSKRNGFTWQIYQRGVRELGRRQKHRQDALAHLTGRQPVATHHVGNGASVDLVAFLLAGLHELYRIRPESERAAPRVLVFAGPFHKRGAVGSDRALADKFDRRQKKSGQASNFRPRGHASIFAGNLLLANFLQPANFQYGLLTEPAMSPPR